MVQRTPTSVAWRGLADLQRDIERSLSHSCRDRNDLDDMVQETLLRAARFRGGLKDPSLLRPWVLRIAWNVMREYRRSEGRRRQVDVSGDFFRELEGGDREPESCGVSEPMPVGDRFFESDDLLRLLTEACCVLKPDERYLLGAFYRDGVECRQMGRRLGIGTHSVKMRLFRLRRRLRRVMAVRAATLSTPRFPVRECVA
jgi:RNA polymerase sigma factor (sigma-70 family)